MLDKLRPPLSIVPLVSSQREHFLNMYRENIINMHIETFVCISVMPWSTTAAAARILVMLRSLSATARNEEQTKDFKF
jgi:hypothetical protein